MPKLFEGQQCSQPIPRRRRFEPVFQLLFCSVNFTASNFNKNAHCLVEEHLIFEEHMFWGTQNIRKHLFFYKQNTTKYLGTPISWRTLILNGLTPIKYWTLIYFTLSTRFCTCMIRAQAFLCSCSPGIKKSGQFSY